MKKSKNQKNYYENIISNLQTKAFQADSGEFQKKLEEVKEKKIKKKRTNYKELLYDPILEHIGREDKPNPNKNNEFEEMSSISENSKKNEKNKKVSSTNTNKNKQKSI